MDGYDMGIRPPISESPTQEINDEDEHGPVRIPTKHGMWSWQKFQKIFSKQHDLLERATPPQRTESAQPTRRVGIGLPRQATFKRQNSEKRDRLLPVQPGPAERRAISTSRHTSLSLIRPRSTSSPPPINPAHVSAPAIQQRSVLDGTPTQNRDFPPQEGPPKSLTGDRDVGDDHFRPPRPPSRTSSDDSFDGKFPDIDDRAQLNAELDSKWILNLSMHFRDKSDREKFFVTYAQQPNRWRRVTISCDYRDAESGSLETDLKELQYQRDKSMQIYESIRDSLTDIQFYDTVTNLKLETSDGRLHVHVTEDMNEIIPYPPRSTMAHILDNSTSATPPMEIRECELDFDCHLSGFVYKVNYKGKEYIKKEIPGPDTVDEFLYEVNALHDLNGSDYVIRLEAIVVDDERQLVKGLLISYAEKGALVDLLYDHKGEIPWDDRLRWAQQAVQGLSQIHEEGYVQGDLTLSNIVIDQNNDAKIIDINRRGCPVGWEPPEIAKKIASNQRISMYIGEKSDLFQLGMTLWALAMDDDEPERHDPPLSTEEFPSEIPEWYREIVRVCLAPQPRDRPSATVLCGHFPPLRMSAIRPPLETRPSLSVRTEKQYIDPAAAVERDDIERLTQDPIDVNDFAWTPVSSYNDYTFTYPRSSSYEFESGSSYMGRPRGRRRTTDPGPEDRQRDEPWRALDDGGPPPEHDNHGLQIGSPLAEADQDYCDYLGDHGEAPNLADFRAPGDPSPGDHLFTEDGGKGEPAEVAGSTRHMPIPLPALISAAEKTRAKSEDIELDPPHVRNNTSSTSGSTPRNPQSILERSTSTLPTRLSFDLTTADLAGFGGHPSLEEHCPHEPTKLTTSALELSSAPPLRLPFSDSGCDEPVILSEINESTEREDEMKSETEHFPESPEHQQPENPSYQLQSGGEPTAARLPESSLTTTNDEIYEDTTNLITRAESIESQRIEPQAQSNATSKYVGKHENQPQSSFVQHQYDKGPSGPP